MRRSSATLLLLAALGLIGTLAVLRAWAGSAGLAPDSYVYLASARSLAAGDGLVIPVGPGGYVRPSHFPPLYAGLLALSGLGSVDPLQSGAWLNALFFGANVFLTGFAIFRLSRGSRWTSALGSLFALGAQSLIFIHTHLWSEPAFFFLALVGLVLLAGSKTASGDRRSWAAALAFALATLVRYAGLTLVLAGALHVLLDESRPWRARLARSAAFLAIGAGPVGLWMLDNLRLTGSLANRGITFHPVGWLDLRRGLETISTWLLPAGLMELSPGLRALLGLIAVLALSALVIRTIAVTGDASDKRAVSRESASPETPFDPSWRPFFLFAILYPLFLLVSLTFFDDQTSLDARILSPAYYAVLVLAAVLLAADLPHWPRPARGVALGIVLALCLAGLYAGWGQLERLRVGEGKGYGSPEWAESRLIEQVTAYPPATPVYSNGHDVLYLLTGRPAIPLPQEISPNTLRGNPNFEAEVAEMAQNLRRGEGVLAYFDDLEDRREYLPSEEELLALLPLRRLTRWQGEGSLYRLDP